MANPFTKIANKITLSLQEMFNQSFDSDFNQNTYEALGFDGQSLQRRLGDNLAQKVTVVGSVTYVGIASPGTDTSSALWQAKKIDQTTGTVITWADGNANFDNVATDLTSLTYS